MATVESFEFPADRWYEPGEHLWLLPDAGAGPGGPEPEGPPLTVTIGIDALGQELLGEVVYVQLAEPGTRLRRGDALGSLEAEKMVRPILAPLTGVVLEPNPAVLAGPRLVNTAPYGAGWLVRMGATRWDAECRDLLHDPAAVEAWVRAEIEKNRTEPGAPGIGPPPGDPGSRHSRR
jgi:glycine cleavage system H protein